VLEGMAYSEAESLPQHLKVNDASTLFLLYCAKLMLSVIFNDREGALAYARKAKLYLKGGIGMHAFALFHFYESLALLANAQDLGFLDKWKLMRAVAANQKNLRKWADFAPMNYLHHWQLVEAERLRVLGKSEEAFRHYDKAIDQARENGFVHEEALAYELAGRCYLARQQERQSGFYLKQALQLYERWGALAKSAQISSEFPQLRLAGTLSADHLRSAVGVTGGFAQTSRISGKSRNQTFDILAVTEASQAISREIVIDDMVTTLLKIVIEHSGAQKALLVLKKGEDFSIRAQGFARQAIEVEVTDIAIGDQEDLPLPRAMIQYVGRTSKSLVIPDARQENLFSRDPYFLREKPLSVLCEPIVHQGKLIGMLYLENNLTADAFTEERLELLRMLSSQAAISIENATLYADMEARVKARTQELAESLETVRQRNGQVSALLDNSGQGFLAFGMGLIVGQEFSQACLTFFGDSPAGKSIDTLLFPDDAHARETLRACVESALDDPDNSMRILYLSLLPEEIIIGGKVLKAEFRPLSRAIMVVLTDITEEKTLAAQVAREQTRLEMIVSAVTSGNDFFESVAEFTNFIKDGPESWRGRDKATLHRLIHTFKGTFNQLGFHHVPAALHEVEGLLKDMNGKTNVDEAVDLVFRRNWLKLLDIDLQTITSALGEDFMARRGVVTISPDQARRFEFFARGVLGEAETPIVLRELSEIRSISLRQSLQDYDKLIQQVAGRLEKSVAPLVIEGEDIRIDPEIFGPFLRSLGHVFRNAVDHGIEDPETRFLAGKEEVGTISCKISRDNGAAVIEISDDGSGIDLEKLRIRAAGLVSQDVSDWSLADLVFADGVSTRTETTELSGRGVGMSAVRATVMELGGSVSVTTRPRHGSSVSFRVPLPPAELMPL
jgi:GAF domain-containing protein/two-component sensor histidine kinase